jgi:hypothetical protein
MRYGMKILNSLQIAEIRNEWRNLPPCVKLMPTSPQEFAMPASTAAFNSVKLPSALVIEARQTAIAMRRSTAGQIEYWAMLGKAVEDGGLTAREAAQALSPKAEVSQAQALLADFVQFDASGQLAQHVRQAIASNATNVQRMAA